jgi:hypothetical protein
MGSADLVRTFLRAQNLEQVGRVDEAIGLYESMVEARFDSAGPYDRLVALYAHRSAHADVVRVATAALERVHTHADKRGFYARARDEARRATDKVPPATPRRPR